MIHNHYQAWPQAVPQTLEDEQKWIVNLENNQIHQMRVSNHLDPTQDDRRVRTTQPGARKAYHTVETGAKTPLRSDYVTPMSAERPANNVFTEPQPQSFHDFPSKYEYSIDFNQKSEASKPAFTTNLIKQSLQIPG